MRITYDGKRAEVSAMRKVDLSKWNSKGNMIKGNSSESKLLNRHFDIMRNRVHEIHQKLSQEQEEITATLIKDIYLGKTDANKFILDMFDEHNTSMEKLIGKDFSFRTLQRYKTTQNHLRAFISSSYKRKDYPVRGIDTQFINAFIYYLKTELNHTHNTALKYLAYLKNRPGGLFQWLDGKRSIL